MKTNVFNITVNPEYTKEHSHVYVLDSLGVLPHWVYAYVHDDNGVDKTLVQYMEEQYGFGSLFNLKGTVKDDKYVSPYKEDKPLDYIAKARIAEGDVYFFPYAIIALPDGDKHFITRMD